MNTNSRPFGAGFPFQSERREKKEMKKRILLVDDEVAVLLTLKAVLEINGFDVDTAASGREGKLKLRSHEYDMVISDMRMESDQAGAAVIAAARSASYQPVVALLTAYPLAEEDWQDMGADRMLVKPMHTRLLLEQIDRLMKSHAAKRGSDRAARVSEGAASPVPAKKKAGKSAAKKAVKAPAGKKRVAKATGSDSRKPARPSAVKG
jgi:DNA-binding response OmpR family regulator